MNITEQRHKFTDFWKIPIELVSFNEADFDATHKPIIVSRLSEDKTAKPELYQWDGAHLFAQISTLNSKSDNISSLIRVDPISRKISMPFNFDQAIENLLTEQYLQQESNNNFVCIARQLYYKLKPFLPRPVQVQIRQKAVDRMAHRKFPIWELDMSVDLLHRNLLSTMLEVNPGSSLPIISFWPHGADICITLTHDVETLEGIRNIPKIINIEQKLGFRSVWNFVPERYPVDKSLLQELHASGFEIGVHGLYHDGKLFESYILFKQRAGKINSYIKQWNSAGFRSPSNLRNLDWISEHIEVVYDTSSVSTEWYGAQPGGCCTVFPFFYRNLVELPITLQQDFTLLDILKLTTDETLSHWMDTVDSIKNINGLVLLNIHPDYMASNDRLKLYENFLNFVKNETSCWHALPKEVAHWWIDRDKSVLLPTETGWQIDGPASDRGVVMNSKLSEDKLCIQAS